MLYGWTNSEKFCRWDGVKYKAEKPLNRDGFCSKACKQAHYRAYKKYVIAKPAARPMGPTSKVTRKKKKHT